MAIYETELRAMLKAILGLNLKAIESVQKLSNEIGAVRESVRALDPTFSEVLAKHRQYYDQTTGQLLAEIKQEYESLSQRLDDHLLF